MGYINPPQMVVAYGRVNPTFVSLPAGDGVRHMLFCGISRDESGGFLKWGVASNHPFIEGVSIVNHFGISPLMEIPKSPNPPICIHIHTSLHKNVITLH